MALMTSIPVADEGSSERPVGLETSVSKQPREVSDTGLYLIGLFKLAKAIFFVGISLGALHFIHHDLLGAASWLLGQLRFDPENRIVDFVMERLATVTHHKLRLISMGTSLYAMLCLVEGYGLLRRKVWAEFLTLWISVSFLPWEAFELIHRPSAWHLTIIATNLAIVAYLLWLLRRNNRKHSDLWESMRQRRGSALRD